MESSYIIKRKENKMKKIRALLDISTLNEKDRQDIHSFRSDQNSDMEAASNEMYGISDQYSCQAADEPNSKRSKLNDGASNYSITSHDEEVIHEDTDRPKFAEAELAELRSLLKKRRQTLRRSVKLHLKNSAGTQADLDVPASDRVPLFLSDIQHLILYFTLHRDSPYLPRWCAVERIGSVSTVKILFIEGAGISDYLQHKDHLISLSRSHFPIQIEVVMPSAYEGDMVEEFCAVPLTRSQGGYLSKAYGNLEEASKVIHYDVFKVLRTFFPINKKTSSKHEESERYSSKDNTEPSLTLDPAAVRPESLPPTDKFSRTNLLLSAWQMIEEGYPIPLNAELKNQYKDFVFTKFSYQEVNSFSPMYGVDCEMCLTSIGKSECTRVSIVNESLETVLDTLVLPPNKITDYVTRFSGITPEMMKDVTTRLEDVQKWIQENLEPDAILVGQSLNFDLVALKVMHPYCIDTSVIFNLTGDRYKKSKLKVLTEHFLNEFIQTGKDGHCSVEDSCASLKLVQLKLSNSIDFGDHVLSWHDNEIIKGPRNRVDIANFATSLFKHTSSSGKDVAILGNDQVVKRYQRFINPSALSIGQLNEETAEETEASSTMKGRVICISGSTNDDVASKVANQSQETGLVVGHIQLSEHESAALSVGDNSIVDRLNHWVSQMQESASMNSFSIIVICGREKSSNGVLFLNVRKPCMQRLVFKPQPSVSEATESE